MDYFDYRISISAVFLLSIAIGTTGGALVSRPYDQNVTVGQRVTMTCATDLDLPVYWYFKGHEIFYGGRVAMSFQAMFSVSTEGKGEYNLIISSANVSYTGEYICGDDEGQGEKKAAHLYVTGQTSVTVAGIEGSTSDDNNNQMLIICLVVGGIILFLIIAIPVTVCLCKRRARNYKGAPATYQEKNPLRGDSRPGQDTKGEVVTSPNMKDSRPGQDIKGEVVTSPNMKDSRPGQDTKGEVATSPNMKDSRPGQDIKGEVVTSPNMKDSRPAHNTKIEVVTSPNMKDSQPGQDTKGEVATSPNMKDSQPGQDTKGEVVTSPNMKVTDAINFWTSPQPGDEHKSKNNASNEKQEPPENKNAETMAQMYLPVDGTGRIVTDPASPAEVKSSDGGHGVGFNTTGSSADTTKGAVPNTTYPVCADSTYAGRDRGVDSIAVESAAAVEDKIVDRVAPYIESKPSEEINYPVSPVAEGVTVKPPPLNPKPSLLKS